MMLLLGIIMGLFLAATFTFHHMVEHICKSNDMGNYKSSIQHFTYSNPNITIRQDDIEPKWM